MKKNMRLCFLLICLFYSAVYAQSNNFVSLQPHTKSVSALAFSSDESVYSAGLDGFVIKWSHSGGEHYQISDLEIKALAVNPANGDIAVYETNGFSIYRISVWNWEQKTKKFSKIINSEITSLSYSKRGTYIIAGTVSIQGSLCFNAYNGNAVSLLNTNTGIVGFGVTNELETNLFLYTVSGSMVYYDMRNRRIKATFNTESNLTSVILYNNNLFLAGIKDNTIYIIDALSGEILKKIQARSPILAVNENDKTLCYYTKSNTGTYERHIETEEGFERSNIVFQDMTGTVLYCITNGTAAFFGDSSGDIYSSVYYMQPEKISKQKRNPILDMYTEHDYIYFLTDSDVYVVDTNSQDILKSIHVQGFSNIMRAENGFILWSKGQKTTITYISDTNDKIDLYVPESAVQFLSVFNNYAVFIEGNGTTVLYDISLKNAAKKYTGTGFQSAALVDSTLYIAKTTATNPKSALINVNIQTGETARELAETAGDAVYSLHCEYVNLFGIITRVNASSKKTDIVAYNTQYKSLKTLYSLNEEDLQATITYSNGYIYTNLGKNQLTVIDTQKGSAIKLQRSAALPIKGLRSKDASYVLNTDGTVSVYNAQNVYQHSWQVNQSGDCSSF